jgi:hypothetical protein
MKGCFWIDWITCKTALWFAKVDKSWLATKTSAWSEMWDRTHGTGEK